MSEHVTPATEYRPAMPIADLFESKQNPRQRFDPEGLKELEASIREKGVLTPLLVRKNGKAYEIAAGHRRYRAAKALGLEAVPVVVREMTDTELLEVLVIENDQREDVHPLEEADGYRRLLMPGTGYDVARVAARIGRSEKYVYDRMKLLQLVPQAQRLFLEGKFDAGHAILLARLKPADQKRAIAVHNNGNAYQIRGLFQEQHGELPFEGKTEEESCQALKADPYLEVKAVSVREFASYIQAAVFVVDRLRLGARGKRRCHETCRRLLERQQGSGSVHVGHRGHDHPLHRSFWSWSCRLPPAAHRPTAGHRVPARWDAVVRCLPAG